MKTLSTRFFSAAILMASVLLASAETKLKIGDAAPKIEGKTQDEKAWKSSDVVGKKNLLLYFYPKDNTPGCTKEACTLRDRMSDLKNDNVEVIGVSFDDANSHREFIKKYDLNFTLLADTDGKIADVYDVRKEPGKNMARRVSFLIGKDGKIKHITDTPSADVHLSEMKDAVAKLAKK